MRPSGRFYRHSTTAMSIFLPILLLLTVSKVPIILSVISIFWKIQGEKEEIPTYSADRHSESLIQHSPISFSVCLLLTRCFPVHQRPHRFPRLQTV
jgi:hypothetical protein